MRLSDVCEINPRSQAISDDTLVSFVAMPDVSEDGRINTSVVRPYGEVKKGYTVFQEGDILFAKITPCMENGKGALAVELQNGIGVGSTEFHVLRPNTDLLDGMWLYYLTAWPTFRHEAEIHMTGSAGQKRVPKTYLERYQLAIPPLDEQKDQVSQLDRIRRIIDSRQRQLRTLDTLIKARFVEMFEQGTFEEVEFGDICVFLRNGANIKQTKGASGIPITRIETLANDVFNTDRLGYADIFDIGKYISYRLQEGDILISHINSVAYLGRAVQYRGQLGDKPIIHGMNLLCARIIDSFNPTYVEYFFRTPSAKDFISTITKKAVNQASITTTDLRKMRIPAPSIEKQNQFATFVSQVDKSKAAVQAALEKAQLLFDSLMQQYFG